MKQIHKKILFVSNGLQDETQALQHAMRLLNEKTTLDVLIFSPSFPSHFEEHKKSYESFLIQQMEKYIEKAKSSLNFKKVAIKISIEWGETPDIRIVQQVLRHSYDLVFKAAESSEDNKGFKALDMSLLRKCPCPVFLYRPFHSHKVMQIAVAIDPKEENPDERQFALELLKKAQALATHCQGHLNVISCWDFILEHYLRHSVFIDISSKELDNMVTEESQSHYNELNALIATAGIEDKPKIYHLKGNPTEIISSTVNEKKMDVLVMGTVARTGISGFVIGNTAENILQTIDCSLWAFKPKGFVSPVKI